MTDFRVHSFHLRDGYYILLPKLNLVQRGLVAAHLSRAGLKVRTNGRLSAKGKDFTLHVDPVGVCRSDADASDFVLPLIPHLLAAEKEPVEFETLKAMYFAVRKRSGRAFVRMTTRLEHSATWTELRRSNLSALAPDELAVIRLILRHSDGATLVTETPKDGSREIFVGQKPFFLTDLTSHEAGVTMRGRESKPDRSSYLPREGIFEVVRPLKIFSEDLAGAFKGASDWCGFEVPGRKASN